MADQRVTFDVVVSDATTKSQQAAVDASGRVSVNTEFPDAAALADNLANPTTALVGACLLGYDGSTWDRIYAVADGDAIAAGTKGLLSLGTDGSNYQVLSTNSTGHVNIADGGNVISVDDAAGSLTVDAPAGTPVAVRPSDGTAFQTFQEIDTDTGGPTVNRVAVGVIVAGSGGAVAITGDAANGLDVDVTRVTGTVTVDSELPAAAALADNTANPTVPAVGSFLMGWDSTGTNWDRVVVANSGRLQVDVVTGGGETAPTSPTIDTASSSALAAGASADLDSAEITTTSYLGQVVVASSVPFKAVVKKVLNGSATTVATIFGGPNVPAVYRPAHRQYVAVTASAGVDVFRVSVTNEDASEAADVYSSFEYQQN
jgi:hypothetical protein